MHQGCRRYFPTVTFVLQEILRRHFRISHEDLIERRVVVHLTQRNDLNARLAHIHNKVTETVMLRHVEICTGQKKAKVGKMRAGRPDLLSVHDILVAQAFRPGHRTCEI